MQKYVLPLLLALSHQVIYSSPTLSFRSQGRHADRQKMAGMAGQTHLSYLLNQDGDWQPVDAWYGVFDVAIGYMQSFDNQHIVKCLFGSDLQGCDCSTILVQGSNVANRDPKAWLADYLYLNCDYNGQFSVTAENKNIMGDIDLYFGFDDCLCGLYLRLYGPIVWTQWQTSLCATDTGLVSSCTFGGIGYFTPSGTETLLCSPSQYFSGCAPASVDDVTFDGLAFAKIENCKQSKTGFADLRGELGWNFYRRRGGLIGINIQGAAPTGNTLQGVNVFEPIVGNGHHWELGGGLIARALLCESENKCNNVGLYLDANITHLFDAKQRRTFDLGNKPNSRYMLAMQFRKDVTDNLQGLPTPGTGEGEPPAAQFNSRYIPVANLTTFDVDVSARVQVDVTVMLHLQCNNVSLDLGYDFWTRSCESILCTSCATNRCDVPSLADMTQLDTWALKGDARMFGFDASTVPNTVIPLSASENGATIHAGTNVGFEDVECTNVRLQNCGIDNSLFAVAGPMGTHLVIHTPTTAGGVDNVSNQIKTSVSPEFINLDDIIFSQEATSGLSNKVFAAVSYTGSCHHVAPFISLGGSAEFGKNESSCAANICCNDCTLTQWAVWLKAGISFD